MPQCLCDFGDTCLCDHACLLGGVACLLAAVSFWCAVGRPESCGLHCQCMIRCQLVCIVLVRWKRSFSSSCGTTYLCHGSSVSTLQYDVVSLSQTCSCTLSHSRQRLTCAVPDGCAFRTCDSLHGLRMHSRCHDQTTVGRTMFGESLQLTLALGPVGSTK